MSQNLLHPVDIYAGHQLRLKRKALNLSQQALGTCIGKTFQQIQKYEKASNRLALSTLHDICQVLNETPSSFFPTGQLLTPKPTNKDDFAEIANLIHAFRQLQQSSERHRLLRIVQTFVFDNNIPESNPVNSFKIEHLDKVY